MKLPFVLVILTLLVIGAMFFAVSKRHDHALPSQTVNSQDSSALVRYLALGDSYTIGQSVAESERWPNQLVARLKTAGVSIGIVGNPAVTGYTTQDLIDNELPLLATTKSNFVTILIGVNDYVQGVPTATFQKNFNVILDAVEAKVPKDRIVVVTIPDYAKTPTGAQYGDPVAASAAIKSLNDYMAHEAASRGILSVDIYGISQKVSTDSSLIASDGLHPSGAQYTLWTEAIYQALTNAKTFE